MVNIFILLLLILLLSLLLLLLILFSSLLIASFFLFFCFWLRSLSFALISRVYHENKAFFLVLCYLCYMQSIICDALANIINFLFRIVIFLFNLLFRYYRPLTCKFVRLFCTWLFDAKYFLTWFSLRQFFTSSRSFWNFSKISFLKKQKFWCIYFKLQLHLLIISFQ